MKKFNLLLLDANIVIKAFELGLWQILTQRCDIWLAATVVQEAVFFTNGKRSERGISLEEVLQQVGLAIAIPRQFSKSFRQEWTRRGFEEGLGGLGHRDKVSGGE